MKTVASERSLATHTKPGSVVTHNVSIGCLVCGRILRFNRNNFFVVCSQCGHENALSIQVNKNL